MTNTKVTTDAFVEQFNRENEIRNHASAVIDNFLLTVGPDEGTRALQLICSKAVVKMLANDGKAHTIPYLQGVMEIAIGAEFPAPIGMTNPMGLM